MKSIPYSFSCKAGRLPCVGPFLLPNLIIPGLLTLSSLLVLHLDYKRPDFTTEPPKMVRIQGGAFLMGDIFSEGEIDESPVHKVVVGSFELGQHEVTFEEYLRFCQAKGKPAPDDQGWGQGQHPVIEVSWFDAIAYCNWLSESLGLEPVYTETIDTVMANWSANGYRLPTEAEWEYAARGGGLQTRFGNGAYAADPEKINFAASPEHQIKTSIPGIFRQKAVPVESIGHPNQLGLYDMSGNVYEWCWDWYQADYYRESPMKMPIGPEVGLNRVLRGGAWIFPPELIRNTARYALPPNSRTFSVGFRVARKADR